MGEMSHKTQLDEYKMLKVAKYVQRVQSSHNTNFTVITDAVVLKALRKWQHY